MAYQYFDEQIREYLLFRGFVGTLKAFDADIKSEKEKGLRADKVIDQILSYISTFDLNGLLSLWSHLNSRLFRRLDPTQTGAVGRLESGIMKLYLVNAIQNRNSEKVREFFEKMSTELHGQSEWKEWFALPFLPNPEANPSFMNYFSRHWQDTLMLSLHNFLSIIFATLPTPNLVSYHSTSEKLKRLKSENEVMRQTLLKNQQEKSQKLSQLDIQRPCDVMDDFYIIASHETIASTHTENHSRGLKGFLGKITGGVSTSMSSTSSSARDKSRSSSSTRTPSSSTTVFSRHKPVQRLSVKSSNLSQSISAVSDLSDNSENSASVRPFLLLGQEEYFEHKSEVTQCKFSSEGYNIASCDVDGVVKVWSASPGPPNTYATFVSQVGVSALDWFPHSDKKLIYGAMNGIVRICDIDERKPFLHEFTSHQENEPAQFVKQVSCSSNGNLCAIATESNQNVDGKLMVYDLKSMKWIESDLNQTSSPSTTMSSVTSMTFNHNAQLIITGNSDGKVRIFDLRKRDCISSWCLTDHASPILTLQMSADETCIYALSTGGLFSAWSFIQTSQRLFEDKLDDPYYNSDSYPRAAWGKQFAFAGDGKHILTCSTFGGCIYELNNDKLVKILGLKGHRRHATCTDWSVSTDCGPCVTAGFDGQISISTLLSQ